tara:strand:- start:9316 stop:9825 length:510 start_codon:yes stop_codon:yes gene_type:complete
MNNQEKLRLEAFQTLINRVLNVFNIIDDIKIETDSGFHSFSHRKDDLVLESVIAHFNGLTPTMSDIFEILNLARKLTDNEDVIESLEKAFKHLKEGREAYKYSSVTYELDHPYMTVARLILDYKCYVSEYGYPKLSDSMLETALVLSKNFEHDFVVSRYLESLKEKSVA